MARFRIVRLGSQTPSEFLQVVEREKLPNVNEVRTITRIFCDVRYGGMQLTDDLRTDITRALTQIRKRARPGEDG